MDTTDKTTGGTSPQKIGSPGAKNLLTPADSGYATPESASKDLVWSANGLTIDYRATAAPIELRDDAGALIGHMFSLSYVALTDGKPDPSRPVTFCYNGGPGSSSVPVNFGGIGPRRVPGDGERHIVAQPAQDNPYTLLRKSDLVFLDAPGTGFSDFADGVDAKKYFGLDGDADAFARAITRWLEDTGRWSSPLYLFGESYGTVRNACLMRLLGEQGIQLAGVVMLSAIFDWVQTLPGADQYYLGMFPTYAAASQYFGRSGRDVDVDTWFDSAMEFANKQLAPALLAGDTLGSEAEQEIAQRMAEFIGLDPAFIAHRHLRVTLDDFRERIVADEGHVCGRLDMRYISDALHPAQRSSAFFEAEDAADDAVDGPWTLAFRSFLRQELGFVSPVRYKGNNYEYVGGSWNWAHQAAGTSEPVAASNVAFDVATALRRSPATKLAILGGRYDAATPWWNVAHDMSCQFMSDAAKKNIEWHRYGCGHMAYTDEPTLAAMYDDLARFYDKAPQVSL